MSDRLTAHNYLVTTLHNWAVRGSIPVGGEIFRTCLDRPWGPPSLLYKGIGSLSQGKAAGRSVALTTHPI